MPSERLRPDNAAEAVKHTAGPWEAFSNSIGVGVSGPVADIAHCHGFHSVRSREEVEANARLIAAAPDMASDGQFLLDRLSELDFSDEDDVLVSNWCGHVEPAIARFRAAIARATGAV